MRLKTILAKNISEGMRRVREQLGDDAIIVQTEETDGGVLIMAAAEPSPVADLYPTAPEASQAPWHEPPADPAEIIAD
ncbi:MAG TPA: hypothetical protein VHH14_09055, partial [Solirubrobacterales bacterium]|nr:hypothetical protein [Solirubrobacterales bacterium]